jgi:hypothetical protein
MTTKNDAIQRGKKIDFFILLLFEQQEFWMLNALLKYVLDD